MYPTGNADLHAGRIGGHDGRRLEARGEALPAVVNGLILRTHDIPLVLALGFVALDHVARVGAAVHDVFPLPFTPHLDLAVERFRHGDDVRVRLVPRHGVGEAFGTLTALDGEGPEESTEEGDELSLGEINARAGTVAVTEGGVATQVGELGQRLLVGRVGGIDPALGLEFSRIGVERLFTGNKTAVC